MGKQTWLDPNNELGHRNNKEHNSYMCNAWMDPKSIIPMKAFRIKHLCHVLFHFCDTLGKANYKNKKYLSDFQGMGWDKGFDNKRAEGRFGDGGCLSGFSGSKTVYIC